MLLASYKRAEIEELSVVARLLGKPGEGIALGLYFVAMEVRGQDVRQVDARHADVPFLHHASAPQRGSQQRPDFRIVQVM